MGCDKGRTELIDVTGAALTLIVQQDVFRHAVHTVTMVIEVRTLVGPVSVVEHEGVHRDHHAVLGGAMLIWSPRAIGPIKKCDGMIEEFRPAGAIRLLVTLDLPAPRVGLKKEADAALEEVTSLEIRL